MSKSSKAERKEDSIQALERELASVKKKNVELQQQKTVLMNDAQIQSFFDELTKRIEWSTNKIIDEIPKSVAFHTVQKQPKDGFSLFMKCSIGVLFISFALGIAYGLWNIWEQYWNKGWMNRMALFIIAIAGFDCLVLGIEIFREKDRNYIVSLFSALVAFIALIVALVK